MKNDYTFIEQEKDKAAMLCTQWHIGDNAKIVDDWIDLYLQGMKEGTRFINFNKAIFVEQQLEKKYRKSIAHLDKPLLQYLLARLLFYSNNVLQFGNVMCRIDSAYVVPLIKELIQRVDFCSTDFGSRLVSLCFSWLVHIILFFLLLGLFKYSYLFDLRNF